MVIDKSWTSLGKHEKPFYTGLKKFVDDCKPLVDSDGELRWSIWKDSNTPGKKVPKKVLRYFSIIPRQQHLYKSSHTLKEMTWHATGKCTEPGRMKHPVDGRAWKDFDTKYPDFTTEPRNVRLGLVVDGFNPFGNLGQSYSMWPVILTTYNLPSLAMFNMRTMVLWTINDFPARSSLSGWSGQGYRACPTCNEDTSSVTPPQEDKDLEGWIRSVIVARYKKPKRKCSKPQAAYSFHTTEDVKNSLYRASSRDEFPKQRHEKKNSSAGFGKQANLDLFCSTVVRVCRARDERRTTQNSGICSPGGNDGEMYYGQLQEILEFSYLSFKVVLFRVKWFDTRNEGRKVQRLVLRNNMTQILTKDEAFKDDQYILATQVKQCFYLEDMARRPPHWKVVEHVNHKKFSDGGVIVVEEDPDVIHFDNSSDLPLSTSLNDLNNATLHIDGQSTEVDAPPDIIDLDEDDDIIDDEDALPHDLADSDDEDLVNVEDDDGVEVMSADVARGHDGDGGGDDRPPSYHIPTGCGGCFANRGKGIENPIWTLMPLDEHAAHWVNYLGELVRELPLHYPYWRQMPPERKAGVVAKIGTQFDLRPHMESDRWLQIYAGIQQHLQKIYNGKKAALKERHWVPDEDGTYNVERVRREHPSHISMVAWDVQIAFWNDPKNLARAAQNKQIGQRARSYADRDPGYFAPSEKCMSDDKFSQMLTQLESQPEYGSGSGSGGCGDDEPGDDEDDDEDKEDEEDATKEGYRDTLKWCWWVAMGKSLEDDEDFDDDDDDDDG
ncbi:hypothetical protein Tco_0336048 [Tanacetum coccineum]